MDEERLNLPSASGYARLIACPGSYNLESQQPPSEDTPESAAGTRIHAHLAGDTSVQLSQAELDTADLCRKLSAEAQHQWWQLLGGFVTDCQYTLEERLYLRDGLTPIFSGQPDVVVMVADRALILDYKTGWAETTPSGENPQLFALAVLLRHERPHLSDVSVGIIQPSAGMQVELVTYAAADLVRGEQILRQALATAKTSQALATGKHCTYCRAAAVCPAARGEVTTMAELSLDESNGTISNEQLFTLLTKCGPAEKMIGSIRALAKRRLEAGESIQGDGEAYVLKEGAGRRTITDAGKAFVALHQAYGVTGEEFSGCCTAKISEVEGLVRAKSGMKVKDAREALSQALTEVGALEVKAAAPSLERVKLNLEAAA